MAERIIIFWRDIPAQIVVKSGRRSAKRVLPERFALAIDQAAMRAGIADEDGYLAAWRRGEPTLCGEDIETEAEKMLAQIEEAYDSSRLEALVAARGFAERGQDA